ncbi:outer membrane lipoprotein-sorting protein [Thermodesulfobacteriota bacterium]
MRYCVLLAGVLTCLCCSTGLAAQSSLSADQIMQKSINAYYYAGDDARAHISLRLSNKDGRQRLREFTSLRLDSQDGGEQYYYLYFTGPPDVQRMVFLVWKHIGRDDDRWLYLPAVDLVRRISASDKYAGFVGSDFTYEDVSGRHSAADTHSLLREEAINGRQAYVLQSTPKDAGDAPFSYRRVWVEKGTFLTIKVEYYDRHQKPYKVLTVKKVEQVQDIASITAVEMRNLKTGHVTQLTASNIAYNIGLGPNTFQERFLRRPPGKWIKGR